MRDDTRKTRFDDLFWKGIDENIFLATAYPESGKRTIMVNGESFTDFQTGGHLGLDDHPYVLSSMTKCIEKSGTGRYATRIFHTSPELENLENKLASFLDVQQAIVFPNTSILHWGILRALVDKNTIVFMDQYAHTSIREALRGALRHQQLNRFNHNDIDHLVHLMKDYQSSKNHLVAITEGIFSVSGDFAPIRDLHDVVTKMNGILYVDDAHGFGSIGKNGKGVCADLITASEHLLYVGSLRKSLSAFGSFIAFNKQFANHLKLRAFPFAFSGPLPNFLAAGSCAAIEILDSPEYNSLKIKLDENISAIESTLSKFDLHLSAQGAPIVCISLDNRQIVELGKKLHENKIAFGAIGFPALPRNHYCIRISVSARHTQKEIDTLLSVISEYVHSDSLMLPIT